MRRFFVFRKECLAALPSHVCDFNCKSALALRDRVDLFRSDADDGMACHSNCWHVWWHIILHVVDVDCFCLCVCVYGVSQAQKAHVHITHAIIRDVNMLCAVCLMYLYMSPEMERASEMRSMCVCVVCLESTLGFSYTNRQHHTIHTQPQIFRIALRNAAGARKEAEERWVHDPYVFAPKWCPSSEITSRLCTYMCRCTRAQEIRAAMVPTTATLR